MKTLFFATLLSFIFYVCNSQQYEHLIKESKQWRYASPLGILLKSSKENWDYYSLNINYFQGDTIIKNTKYNKSYTKRIMPQSTDTLITLANFLFEDTLNKKVYMLEPFQKNKNVLVYDFSLNEGDSVSTYVVGDIYRNGKVKKVDSVNLVDKLLKRITFEDGVQWIEGIGSTTGIWHPYDGLLICVKENDNVLYLDTALFQNCDTVFTELPPSEIRQEVLNQSNKATVHPNPINNTSIIKLESSVNGTVSLIIYNSFGEQVLNDKFIGEYPVGQLHLTEGLYFSRILYKGKQIGFNKLVVNNK